VRLQGVLQVKVEVSEGRVAAHTTPRERQILKLLADGCANKEISYRLGIAEGTVKLRVGQMLRCGFANRVELARWTILNWPAIRDGRAAEIDLQIEDDVLPRAA
jgi:DNA-binding NarL/FixJ family response regulator